MANEFLQEAFGGEALTFEQFNDKVKDMSLINNTDGSFVPKSDYDKISTQLADAQASVKANDEKYADFEAQLKAARDEGTAALDAYKLEVEVSKAFSSANVADEVSVKANLDMEKIMLGEDGKLTGLEEQLTALKESKPFLFTQPEKKLNLGGSTKGTVPKSNGGIKGAVADYYGNK